MYLLPSMYAQVRKLVVHVFLENLSNGRLVPGPVTDRRHACLSHRMPKGLWGTSLGRILNIGSKKVHFDLWRVFLCHGRKTKKTQDISHFGEKWTLLWKCKKSQRQCRTEGQFSWVKMHGMRRTFGNRVVKQKMLTISIFKEIPPPLLVSYFTSTYMKIYIYA